MNPNDDIEAEVTKLGKTLREPVLVNLSISDGWETADAKVPNLYAGQIHYLSAKTSSEKPLKLAGQTSGGDLITLEFDARPVSQASPYLIWCKTRIQRRLAEGLSEDAIALSVASNLLCRLTAFVGWDESEKVVVSRHELAQPAMHPGPRFCLARAAAAGEVNELCESVTFRGDSERQPGSLFSKRSARPFFGFLRKQTPPLEELRKACGKFGGNGWNEWQKPLITILDWLNELDSEELSLRTEAIRKLTVKLKLVAELMEILKTSADRADLIKRLRVSVLQFRKDRRQSNAVDSEFKDIEAIVRLTETVSESTSSDELASLAENLRIKGIEIVNCFVETIKRPCS